MIILGFPGCLLLLPSALAFLAALVVAAALLAAWPVGWVIERFVNWRHKWIR